MNKIFIYDMDGRNILRHKSHVITKSYMLGMGGGSSRNRVAPTPPPIPPALVRPFRVLPAPPAPAPAPTGRPIGQWEGDYGINLRDSPDPRSEMVPIPSALAYFANTNRRPIGDAVNTNNNIWLDNMIDQMISRNGEMPPRVNERPVTYSHPVYRSNFIPLTSGERLVYDMDNAMDMDDMDDMRPATTINGRGVRPTKGSQEMKDKMARLRSMRKK